MSSTAVNSPALTPSISRKPIPPSLASIYEENKTLGLGAVFEEFDLQNRTYSDQTQQAEQLPGPPISGGGPLLTPQQQAIHKANLTGSTENRLGWARAFFRANNPAGQLAQLAGGWPLTVNLTLGSHQSIQVSYHVPPVPGKTRAGNYDLILWPIPRARIVAADPFADPNMVTYESVTNPHLRVWVTPAIGLPAIIGPGAFVQMGRRTKQFVNDPNGGHIVFTESYWLGDKDGYSIPIDSVYAELI